MGFIKDISNLLKSLFIYTYKILRFFIIKIKLFLYINIGIFKYRAEMIQRNKKLINSYNDNKNKEYL